MASVPFARRSARTTAALARKLPPRFADSLKASNRPRRAAEPPIRIVIADDHPVFRYGLRHLLGTQPDFAVIAEATDGNEALTLIDRHHPDILLLDFSIRGLPGLEVLRRLRHRATPRVIVLSAGLAKAETVAALEIGARGVLLKDSPVPLLFQSIRTVFGGELWLRGQSVADVVQAATAGDHGERRHLNLTLRERDVLTLLATGETNRGIARKLSISEDTVKHHLTNIFNKTGTSNRLELTLSALQHQLIKTA